MRLSEALEHYMATNFSEGIGAALVISTNDEIMQNIDNLIEAKLMDNILAEIFRDEIKIRLLEAIFVIATINGNVNAQISYNVEFTILDENLLPIAKENTNIIFISF